MTTHSSMDPDHRVPASAGAAGLLALQAIRNEHSAILAVLGALDFVTRRIASGSMQPNPVLLASLIDYIAEMPDKLHHPKEDRIFELVRARTSEVDEVLDVLEEEHRQAVPQTSALDRALVHYLRAGEDGFPAFRKAVCAYIAYETRHMEAESHHVFPVAQRVLTAEEWAAINADFARNADPWRGLNNQFSKLFSDITRMTPAPMGLGDP